MSTRLGQPRGPEPQGSKTQALQRRPTFHSTPCGWNLSTTSAFKPRDRRRHAAVGHGHDCGCGGELNMARAERAHVRALVGDRANAHAQRLGAPWANVGALNGAFGGPCWTRTGYATIATLARAGTLRICESVPERHAQAAGFAMRTAAQVSAKVRICPAHAYRERSQAAPNTEPSKHSLTRRARGAVPQVATGIIIEQFTSRPT